MLGTLLRPRWLAAHLVIALIAVAFVNLGLWQLRRLDERKSFNAAVAGRVEAQPRPLDVVLAELGNDPQQLTYQPVEVSGTYLADDEVLLTPRNDDGLAGHHVLTPLLLDDQTAVLVDRGWVPFALDRPPVAEAAPPAGPVRVSGLLVPTTTAGRFGSVSQAGDRVEFLSAPDVDRLQPQVDVTLQPFSILLREQAPAGGELPRTPPLPDLTEGPHLSYALQWFLFTLVGLVGYPLWVRRRLRQEKRLTRLAVGRSGDAGRSALQTQATTKATTP